MKAHAARTPFGLFAFSDDGRLLSHHLTPTPEEAIKQLKQPFDPRPLALDAEIAEDPMAYRYWRLHCITLLKETAAMTQADIQRFLNRFGVLYSQSFLSTAVTPDKLLIQASQALEDIKRTVNIYQERMGEWFSLHYPEVNRKGLAEKVVQHGNRANFPGFKASLGIELTPADESALKGFAQFVTAAEHERKRLETYVTDTAKRLMPNVCEVIDPQLAARFVALAGSVERLARMPASTIQLLGAEKSLFRHLKQQGKSPKYGILFLDGRVQSAPDQKRGKIARTIASKLMQAARIDFYSGRREPKLAESLARELETI